MKRPDYQGGSIVNLMSSIIEALGGNAQFHPTLSSLTPDTIRQADNVVLFVIDGLGDNYLQKKAKHSFLNRHRVARLTSVVPTTTASAITTFLTGMAPQQHGLTGWFTYFHDLGSIITVLPFTPRHGGVQLSELNIDVKALYGHVPVFDLLNVDSYIVSPESIAESDYSLAHAGKAQIKAYGSLAQCFDTTAELICGARSRKFIYTYWPMLDSLAHLNGIASNAVAQHFSEIDTLFEQYIHQIKGTNTLVMLTADHGLIDSDPAQCIDLDDHPKLSDMLVMPLSGERRLAYCYVHADKHQAFEKYITDHFGDYVTLLKSQQLLEKNYFGLGPAHTDLHHRIGDYALIMEQNATIMDSVPGEQRNVHVGTHGGLSADEMYVPLIVLHDN